MIKITLGQLYEAYPILKNVMEQKFTGKIAFQLARLVRELDKEMVTFENSRNAIIEKYAEKDDEGKIVISNETQVKIENDKINDCNKELFELLSSSLEINAEKIPSSVLENLEITPVEMSKIIDFINE